MTTQKLRKIENLIILTFAVVLFAGCAGSDVKPVLSEPTQLMPLEQDGKLVEDSDGITNSEKLPVLSEDTGTDDSGDAQLSQQNEEKTNLTQLIESDAKPVMQPIPDNKVYFFETDSSALSDSQKQELIKHADYLKATPAAVLVINGHADERGSEVYNQTLSEKRAKETFKYLVSLGVTKDQLLAKGFGELVPLHTESNWDENRRVELQYTDPMMLSSM